MGKYKKAHIWDKKAILFHPIKKTKDEWSKQQLHLNKGKHSPLPYYDHAKLLGVTFSPNCTFQYYFGEVLKKAKSRVSHLYRFTGKIPPEILHRVYKVAVEPIVLYGYKVLYENYTIMKQKKLLNLNWNAIKIAYNLPRLFSTNFLTKTIHFYNNLNS